MTEILLPLVKTVSGSQEERGVGCVCVQRPVQYVYLGARSGPFCFTSTEARLLIRGGERGGRGRESKGSTADTARKRLERPWTAARTVEVSPRHCPATGALRNCCFNCRAGQSHRDNVEEQPEAKEGQLSQPSSTSLLLISSGLTLGSSSTSLLDLAWNPECLLDQSST